MSMNEEELQYLNIIQKIIDKGVFEKGRNGNTYSIFGESMRFSLQNGKIPILTTKKTAWKTCLKELLWFIRGETDNKILQKQGVHIWDGNTSRKFLDSRGLTLYPEGIAGPIYGSQWRYFGSSYNCFTGKPISEPIHPFEPYDQLQFIIDQLKNPETRNSRRLVINSWNPKDIDKMVIPPCHVMCQFNVHNGNKLSCAMFQRSADFALGIPFNIASYSFLTHLIAKHSGLEAYEFVHFIGNAHIYEEHIECIKQQLNREPYDFPTLNIKTKRENINDYQVDDFELSEYNCHESIKMKMIV